MKSTRPIRYALLSVFDKTGIIEFANALVQRDISILSTTGTTALLRNAGLNSTDVAEYTALPDIMDGRLKTLNNKIHGGILGRRGIDDAIMSKLQIQPIDLVVVNLCPFSQIIASPNSTLADVFDNIDNGGCALIHAAAKNHKDVTVVVNSADYANIIKELDNNQRTISLQTRFNLAVKAFEHMAAYHGTIANYLGMLVPDYSGSNQDSSGSFPRTFTVQYIKKQNLQHGENEHQLAAFYLDPNLKEVSISTARQIQGDQLDYNNIINADIAFECVKEFSEPTCVIVKHGNPCGVAIGETIQDAYQRAYSVDKKATVGGVIAINRTLNIVLAELIIQNQTAIAAIVVPRADHDALTLLANKLKTRILVCGPWQQHSAGIDFKRVSGGLLVQERDSISINANSLKVVTQQKPSEQQIKDALFSWKITKYVKSDAVIYGKNLMTLGIGSGQTSRIYSTIISGVKAKEAKLNLRGAVMATDTAIQSRENIDTAVKYGISCIIQPGGSVYDNEMIAVANEYHIAMIMTYMTHFRN